MALSAYSGLSAANNLRKGKFKQAAFDALGAIPGGRAFKIAKGLGASKKLAQGASALQSINRYNVSGLTPNAYAKATDKVFNTLLNKAKDTLTDPLALGLGALSLTSALSTPQQQALGTPRRVAPIDPADPQFARTAIDVDPVTGEDRFSEESLVSRVVEEGEGRGLGRQLTDAFTDPSEEIEVAQAAGGGIISLYPGGSTGSPGGGNNPSHSGHPYYGGPLPGLRWWWCSRRRGKSIYSIYIKNSRL